MDLLTGASAKAQKDQMEAQQRRTLAQFAADQGNIDQAASTGAKRTGRGLLTFLSGQGQATLG